MNLTVALITNNEEVNMRKCLDNVKWADQIVVVDSQSTDRTREIAKEYTQLVYEIPFENFAVQKNNALGKATRDWIFLIDADEIMTDELIEEIKRIVEKNDQSKAYSVHRRTFFFGKEMRFGGVQDDQPIRLFPRGKVHYERPVHEEIVTELPIEKLENCLLHYSTRDREHYQEKLDCYIPFEIQLLKKKQQRIYPIEMYLRPVLKFAHLYLYKLGILDGAIGFEYARLSAYYEFLKCKKYLQSV